MFKDQLNVMRMLSRRGWGPATRAGLIAALVPFLMVQTARADVHVVTNQYNDIEADGNWIGSVAAGEHQEWTFTITEERLQVLEITNIQPAGASLNVSFDAEDLGTVTGEGKVGASLAAGSHTVTVTNPGDSTVEYYLYLGNVSLSVSPATRTVASSGGTATFSVTANNSQILFGVTVFYTGPFAATFPPSFSEGVPFDIDITVPAAAAAGTTTFTLSATGTFCNNLLCTCVAFPPCPTHTVNVTGTIIKLTDPHLPLEAKLDALEVKADSIEAKLDASLDTTVSSRASQTSVDVREGKADALEVKLDALEVKADSIEAKVDQIERKVLEAALVGDDLYPLLATPVTVDAQGKLEEVLAVVQRSIANFNAMGLETADAQEKFEVCQDLVAAGIFVEAVEHCSEAMQALMGDD